MKKKELLKMRKLTATPAILSSANQDELKIRNNAWYADRKGYHIGQYMRCLVERDILKVAFFLTEHLRAGGNLPAFELFIDRKNECFITYDCLNNRWLNAKLDMLPWPAYVRNSCDRWMNDQNHNLIKTFLGTSQGGYAGLVEYQLTVREKELVRKHKRETDPWDLELSQTRELPKDWESLYRKELLTTGLQEFVRRTVQTDPERYLANYIRVPQLEQMLKADLKYLVRECFRDCDRYKAFFAGTQETSLIKAMGIDGPRLKRLRDSQRGLDYLKWLKYEKAVNGSFSDEMLCWFCQEGIEPKQLNFATPYMSILQIYNYIRRQMKDHKESSRWVINTWSDYLAMANRLRMDTSDAIIYRVRKLKQRHEELVKRCEELKEELWLQECKEKFPHVSEIYQRIKPIFSYTAEDYTVIVPSGIEDIIEEGSKLHHCVGNNERYLERIEGESSYVLFLRHTKNPKKPYYTLEVEPDGTVRQKRTMFDRQEKDIEEATAFLRKWQSVVANRLTSTEKKLAVRSKELREQEFLELKNNGVRIWTGGYNGRPLLEILMEDLMVNANVAAEPVLAAAA